MRLLKGFKRQWILIVMTVAVLSPLNAGQLYRIYTGYMLGYNDVQVSLEYGRLNLNQGALNQFLLQVDYGVSGRVTMQVEQQVLQLAGISDSLVLGDISFRLLGTMGEWFNSRSGKAVQLFLILDFKAGISVQEGEGKTDPVSGEKITYYPFATGTSEYFIGTGVSFPLFGLTSHINFGYYTETDRLEDTFEFNFRNDHVRLGFGLEYYRETWIGSGARRISLAYKPFYEARFRFNWSAAAAMPQQLDNSFGFWLRVGSLFRFSGGLTVPVSLDSRALLDSEIFFKLAMVFR